MEGIKISENQDFEKMREWERVKKEAEMAGDTLGMGVDEGIKDTVVALNVSGLPTSSSCEGHWGRGILLPWIEVSAPGEPEERFEGENEIARNIAGKYAITEEDVRRANNEDAWREWRLAVANREETGAHKKWRKENEKLKERAEELLHEFYKDYASLPAMRLVVRESASGDFYIRSRSKHAGYPLPNKGFSTKEKEKYLLLQENARKEMNSFTKFLREKYFSG